MDLIKSSDYNVRIYRSRITLSIFDQEPIEHIRGILNKLDVSDRPIKNFTVMAFDLPLLSAKEIVVKIEYYAR